jgi:type II secretory pathway pseudopilin PulG
MKLTHVFTPLLCCGKPRAGRMQAPRTAGFTLVELLVAATLTILLGGLLLAASQGVISGFTRTQANIVRQGDLSFALDQIVLDMEGLVIPNAPGAEGLRITFENVGDAKDVPWLTFLTTAMDPDNSSVPVGGATRAVSYRLARQRTIDGDTTSPEAYGLYRSIASSAHTFENALNTTDLQANYWASIPSSPSPAPASPTAVGNLLSENIVGISVLFQYKDNAGNFVWTLPDDKISIRRDGAFINDSTTPVEGGFLRAQISVTAISPEGAKRLQGGMAFDEVLLRYGTTVVRQTAFF